MSKNIATTNQSNLYNQIIPYGDTSSGYISNLYPSSIICQQSEYDNFINSSIIADIPTIFIIDSIKTCGPKLVCIKYKVNDPQLNTLSKNGNIYISSGVFGVYDALTNFYWKNEIIVEVESEEYINTIQPGMKFTNATQWEKKLTVEEIINMINDPFEYYKYVHKIVEKYVEAKPRNISIKQHQAIDKIYGLE